MREKKEQRESKQLERKTCVSLKTNKNRFSVGSSASVRMILSLSAEYCACVQETGFLQTRL